MMFTQANNILNNLAQVSLLLLLVLFLCFMLLKGTDIINKRTAATKTQED